MSDPDDLDSRGGRQPAAFCRERLASYKVPARIVFRKGDEFPRTPTGKIQKPRLREKLA